MNEKFVYQLIGKMIEDERKAREEYRELLNKLVEYTCCFELVNKIMKDEISHFETLKAIKDYVCRIEGGG